MAKSSDRAAKHKNIKSRNAHLTQTINAKKLVADANKVVNPLENLSGFEKLDVDGLSLLVKCAHASELPKDTLDWAFALTECNMKSLYEQAGWGWNAGEKRKELCHKKAWYLLVHDKEEHLRAFVHFRFVTDFGEPVVYCYELQVDPSAQRQGIGHHLMNMLHHIAVEFKMKKVQLTVLKCNEKAYAFYTRTLNFKIDETSPSKFGEECCYEILSQDAAS